MRKNQASQRTVISKKKRTWSIAEVERETGLGKDTLRVWEKRYGFPEPERDDQGERAYPDDQVQRLRFIKRLMDVGHRPGKVASLSLSALKNLGKAASVKNQDSQIGTVGENTIGLPGAEDLIDWVASDRPDLIKQYIHKQIIHIGLSRVVNELVAPMCLKVGEAWMQGTISVYQEHLFTEILQYALREAIASVDKSTLADKKVPRVLLTTTPGELHSLGLLMAECHFALESCECYVLGTSTPIEEIVLAARRLKIDVLALSFSSYSSRRDVQENLKLLVEKMPSKVAIWVGGAGASALKGLLPEDVLLLDAPAEVEVQVKVWRSQHKEL